MPYAASEECWRQHGVGNQLALDFLNTGLIAGSEPVELLPDAA